MHRSISSAALLSFAIFLSLLLGVSSAGVADPTPAPPATPKAKTVAIFVKNRAKSVDDAKVTAMEDLVTSKITDAGFHVINRENVANSVKAFAETGPNAGDDKLAGAKLDALLSNNTSALRLLQNMGADYGLMVSITTYGKDVQQVNVGDVHAVMTEFKLVCSYQIISGVTGETLVSDVVKANKKFEEQPGNNQAADVIDDLLDSASTKLADSLKAKATAPALAAGPAAGQMPEFYVECTMTDLEIPEVTKDAYGYHVTPQTCKLDVMAATVELDGVVVGTTPGPLNSGPGLHKIRITRDGFKEWVQTVAIRDGLHLKVPMQLTDEGNARWKGNVAFLEQMKNNAKYTDADVKRIEGMAEMFKNSGFKVDYKADVKSDVKVDKKSDLKVNSIWPEPTDQPAATPAGTPTGTPAPVTPTPGK